MAAPPQPDGLAVEIYFSPLFPSISYICIWCSFFADCSQISHKNAQSIDLSKMSVFKFPSWGKSERMLYVATTGIHKADLILSFTCLIWIGGSLSPEMLIFPSSWTISELSKLLILFASLWLLNTDEGLLFTSGQEGGFPPFRSFPSLS